MTTKAKVSIIISTISIAISMFSLGFNLGIYVANSYPVNCSDGFNR